MRTRPLSPVAASQWQYPPSDVESPKRLTTTEYAVLGMVGYGERSGYDLARAAARGVGYIWTPSRSQIYKVLPRLAAWGLVISREVEQRGRPDKALYRITSKGRAALRGWIEEVEDEPAGGASVFLLKILYAWAAPADAGLAQLDAYRRLIEANVARFEELAGSLPADEPAHSLVALRHGIARGRATLAWIEEARRTLGGARRRRPAAGAPGPSASNKLPSPSS
jgi:DNA-binding PadR family transcriptional regulator